MLIREKKKLTTTDIVNILVLNILQMFLKLLTITIMHVKNLSNLIMSRSHMMSLLLTKVCINKGEKKLKGYTLGFILLSLLFFCFMFDHSFYLKY
jgi:hypothetical protein